MIHDRFSDFEGIDDFLAGSATPDLRPVNASLVNDPEVGDHFRRTVSKLGRLFPIDVASLIFWDEENKLLRAVYRYENGSLAKGLVLAFPPDNSLLFQTLQQGFPVADNYPDLLTTHVIEKKLLVSPITKSVLIIPLRDAGRKIGLMTLSSQQETAFGMYLDGIGQGIIDAFIGNLVALVCCDIEV